MPGDLGDIRHQGVGGGWLMKEVGQPGMHFLAVSPLQPGGTILSGGDPGWFPMSWVQGLMRDSGHTHPNVHLPGLLA